MAKLKDKIENALIEGRMLVLGSQVLLGFEYAPPLNPASSISRSHRNISSWARSA